jgi:AbrB family looped-hinge helix DNA binding protein
MIYNIKMTTRGRMTIPAEIRKKYGIKGRTRIRFIPDEEHRRVFIIPMTKKYFRSLAGVLKPKQGEKSMLKSLME